MADEYIGAKLRITTEEGTYEGIVHTIDINRRKLTLSKVVSISQGKPPKSLHGFHNFFGHELNNLEILDKDYSSGQEKKQDQVERRLPEQPRNSCSSAKKPEVSPNVHQTSSIPTTTSPGNQISPQTSSRNNVQTSRFPGNNLPQSTSSVNNTYTSTLSGYNIPESRIPNSNLTGNKTPPTFPGTTQDQTRPIHHPSNKTQHGQFPGQPARSAQAGVFRNALQGAGLQFKKPIPAPGTVTKDASDDGDVLLNRRPIAAEQYLENDFFFDDGEELSPRSPPKAVILDERNDRFYNAIKNITSQRVVGLSCEGVNLGRHGKICWLIIGCRHFTYLFDVLSLGESCFDQGLAEILENGNILKVTHDCRQMSDALFHQFSIKLVNIFDTQVADIMIYKQERGGNLPTTVNGLVYCLFEYLNLSPEQTHFQKVRTSNMQKDAAIWSKRPLPQQVTDAAAKRVMYLRELRLAQMERMMAEFIYGVNIYLSVVRDGKDYKVNDKKHLSKSRQVPPQFQGLYKFQHRHRARKYDDDTNVVHEEIHPVNRSAWQEGGQFTETYKNVHGHIKEQRAQTLPGWDEIWQGEGRGKGTGTDPYEEDDDEQVDSDNDGFEFAGFSDDLRNDFQGLNISSNSHQSGQSHAFVGGAASGNSNFSPNGQGSRDTAMQGQEMRDNGMHTQEMRDTGMYSQGMRDQNKNDQVADNFKMRDSGMYNQGIHDQQSFHHDQRMHGQEPRSQETSKARKDISPRTGHPDSRNYSKTISKSPVFYEEDFPPLSDSDSSASNFSTPPRPKRYTGNPQDDTLRSPATSSYLQPSQHIKSNDKMNLSNSRNGEHNAPRGNVTHNAQQGSIAHNAHQRNVTHDAQQDNFTCHAFQDNLTQHGFEHNYTHNAPQENFTHHSSQDRFTHNAPYDNTHDASQDVRFKSQSPEVPMIPFVGRGRATLFQHMSHIPQARLPRQDNEPVPRQSQPTVGGLASRYSFPTDNELLSTPQVTLVNHSTDFIPGGARVRIRQTNEPVDQE